MRISAMEFNYVSMAVDSHGYTHVAAAEAAEMEQGIWYLTNSGGSWTSTEVVAAAGRYHTAYTRPSLALDVDDSVWIAFTRESCPPDRCTSMDIAYVTNAGGAWTDPVVVAGPDAAGPTLAVRNGVVHLTYSRACDLGWNSGKVCDWALFYGTTGAGNYAERQMLDLAGSVVLDIDDSGAARLLVSPMLNPPVKLIAAFQASDFAVENIWQVSYNHPAYANPLWFDEGSDGDLRALWSCWCEGEGETLYSSTRPGESWTRAIKLLQGVSTSAVSIDASGVLQLAGAEQTAAEGARYVYGDNAIGQLETRPLVPTGAMTSGGAVGGPGSIGLGVDGDGRPHIVYIDYGTWPPTDSSLWYVEGPAPRRP